MLTAASVALAAASLSIALPSNSWAQSAPAASPKPAAAPDSPAALPEQEIGHRFTIKADDLPPPKTGPIASSRSMTLPYTGQVPRVPDGFTATPFVTGLEHPRRLLVLPNGDVLVAEQKVGYVTLLRDDDGDGKVDWINRHIEGLKAPYGLAWRDGKVLVADQDGIWEVPHRLGALRPGAGASDTKAADVPPEQPSRAPLSSAKRC